MVWCGVSTEEDKQVEISELVMASGVRYRYIFLGRVSVLAVDDASGTCWPEKWKNNNFTGRGLISTSVHHHAMVVWWVCEEKQDQTQWAL